jgi:CheY-like chemotaxis protein
MVRQPAFSRDRIAAVWEGITMTARKKVLLVDDNHDVLDLLEVFLFGKYDCIAAINGFEGLKAAREIAPDIIVSDIMMPVMDGIKFLNSLREDPKTASIPVIAITSFIKKANIKSLLSMGFAGVVSKPFERIAIISMIEKSLGEKK